MTYDRLIFLTEAPIRFRRRIILLIRRHRLYTKKRNTFIRRIGIALKADLTFRILGLRRQSERLILCFRFSEDIGGVTFGNRTIIDPKLIFRRILFRVSAFPCHTSPPPISRIRFIRDPTAADLAILTCKALYRLER